MLLVIPFVQPRLLLIFSEMKIGRVSKNLENNLIYYSVSDGHCWFGTNCYIFSVYYVAETK